MRPKILILSHSKIQQRMTGPAIRCWEFSRALAKHHSVTLATPNLPPDTLLSQTQASLISYDDSTLLEIARQHDVLLVQGFLLEQYPFLNQLEKILIVDLYDPFPLESLENPQETEPPLQWQRHFHNMATLNRQIMKADFMICASEKQKDYWLGMLTALYRINPATHGPGNFQHMLEVVPFGIPEQLPPSLPGRLRGLQNEYGIQQNDFLLIWGGGIWDWLDPLTPIRAVAQMVETGAAVKLFFMGVVPPHNNLPQMQMGQQAIALAKELGVYGTHVIFNQEWIPYEERYLYLRDADVGISSHFDHLETRFSFRTRVMDYLWASLPIITTCGDTVAQWVEESGSGRVVDFKSVNGWVDAICHMQQPHHYKKAQNALTQLREPLSWHNVTQPLVRYCQNPVPAPDKAYRNRIYLALILLVFPYIERVYTQWERLGTTRLLIKVWKKLQHAILKQPQLD